MGFARLASHGDEVTKELSECEIQSLYDMMTFSSFVTTTVSFSRLEAIGPFRPLTMRLPQPALLKLKVLASLPNEDSIVWNGRTTVQYDSHFQRDCP